MQGHSSCDRGLYPTADSGSVQFCVATSRKPERAGHARGTQEEESEWAAPAEWDEHNSL